MNIERVVIMVPSFNEGNEVVLLCKTLQELYPLYTILVIDDGSEVPLDENSLPEGVVLFNLPSNYGLGMVSHIAIDYMLFHNYDVLVRVDGDNQHPVEMIVDLIKSIQSGSDLCIGLRINASEGKGIRSFLATLIRSYFTYMAKNLSSKKLPDDLSSGFMAFNKNSGKIISNHALERYPEPDIMMLVAQAGLTVTSIPVEQLPRREGKSTISYHRAILLFYRFNIYLIVNLFNRIKFK